jgi:hypothetical protein
MQTNSRVVSESLESYAADPGHVRDVFGQYYLWRIRFHRAMWRAIIRGRRADTERLVEAARLEIWEHITFRDDVYYAILGMENELAS